MTQLHLLHGILRRWAKSSVAQVFLLRGGLLLQAWVGREARPTRDIDFLGLFPHDMAVAEARLREILATPFSDGIKFDLDTLTGQVIWAERACPGLRFQVNAGEGKAVQIDVGFGDPVIPAACWLEYPCADGTTMPVWGARPELLAAWKLDGLFDLGVRRWQAKDLYDLYLLTGQCSLEMPLLAEAIRVAFATHGTALSEIPTLIGNAAWWRSESAQARWAKYRAGVGEHVPTNLEEVATAVERGLRPALALLEEQT